MAFDIGSVVAHIKADLSQFEQGLDEAKSQANSFGSNLQNVAANVRSFAQEASIFVGVQALAFGGAAKFAVDYAASLEQARIAYDAFTGSAVKGKEALTEVTEFARKTPFQLPEVVSAGQQLLGFGFSLDGLTQKLREVGSLAVATNTPMSVAIDLFARAREGIFNLREYGQFGISREALEQFGVSFDKAGSALNKSELLPALEKLIQARFGDVLAEESRTFSGTVSNIRDDIGRLAAAIVGVNSSTGEIVKGGIFDKLKEFVTTLYAFIEAHMDVVKSLAGNKVFQSFLEGLAIAIASLVIIIPTLLIALNPVVLIVLGIEAAITLLYMAWSSNFLGIRDITAKVVAAISDFFNNYLKPLLDAFRKAWSEHWQTNLKVLQDIWQIIVGVIQVAWAIFSGVIKVGLDILNGNWKKAWDDILGILKGAWDGMVNIFNGALDFLRNWGGSVLQALVQPFEDAWSRIQSLMNKIKSALDFTQRHSPSVIDIIENGVRLANDAMSKLAFNNTFSVNPQAAFAGAYGAGSNIANEIHIHMDGAVVADQNSAMRVGEIIGDSIIRKLKLNIRV